MLKLDIWRSSDRLFIKREHSHIVTNILNTDMNDKCSNYLGFLLNKVLILPILKHHRRKAHTEIVGFSIVAVCQMRDEAIHPAFLWKLEHLAFLHSKTHREVAHGYIKKNKR